MNTLSGKVALITGASRGIGRAIAIELAQKGAIIAVNYCNNDEKAEEVIKELNEIGVFCRLIKGDISNPSNCEKIIDEVISVFGKIDILINNAAKSEVGLYIDSSSEDISNLINTNLIGPMMLSRYALNNMISKKSGVIVNISSIWGSIGASCEVTYSTTKGGINLFTKALAKEVASFGVRVNAVAPGVINTEMNNFLSDDEKSILCEEIPMNRFGKVEEIAKVVSFLCSDESSYLTGQIITVDGGYI